MGDIIMNKYIYTLACATLGCALLAPDTLAQRGRPDGPANREKRGPQGRPEAAAGREAVDAWLESVQQNDPEEYQRLMELRETHPDAFRLELRSRVQEARSLRRIRESHPGFYDYLSGLEQEERDQLGQLLHQMATGAPPMHQRHRRLRFPDVDTSENVREQVAAWKETEDEAEKDRIALELRETLIDLFNQRTHVQAEEIERVEAQLEQLRDLLAAREASRDEWVDRLMDRFLQ
jgi:hypothetical protein